MKEKKCWGEVEHGFNYPDCGTSYLQVEAGWRCSVHFHQDRHNDFRVLSGCIVVGTCYGDGRMIPTILGPGESFTAPKLSAHFFGVLEKGVVLETYWADVDRGLVHREDIVRFDQGGRWGMGDQFNPIAGKVKDFQKWYAGKTWRETTIQVLDSEN